MPPLPKKKRTKARVGTKRSRYYKLKPLLLGLCPQCHGPRLPHHICPTCGYYNGKLVVEKSSPTKKKEE